MEFRYIRRNGNTVADTMVKAFFSARRLRLYISSVSNESLGAFLSQKNGDGRKQAKQGFLLSFRVKKGKQTIRSSTLFQFSYRVAIDPMWIGDSLSAQPAKTFMSIGALFCTHICSVAVIGLEESQALLDKGIAEFSLSDNLQTEAEKLQGPRPFIGLIKRERNKERKMRKDIRRALAHILPKSCDKLFQKLALMGDSFFRIALTSQLKVHWCALAEWSSPAQARRLAPSFSYCAGRPGRARLGSYVSGVRSDQPATGLWNKELSKGQEIDRRTWPKSVLCSIQLRRLAGWKGLLYAVCLSLLSLLLAK
ncbi:hypothetical protein V6N11_043841 [Hibiscus sabdariffa]|uniref:RNase H type-1 domain-containing protein n=1 Tax=Hibiscus sabdariffa TaxID=183260 RepID=A0ABR2RDE6_9ROSI